MAVPTLLVLPAAPKKRVPKQHHFFARLGVRTAGVIETNENNKSTIFSCGRGQTAAKAKERS